jgi:hypothetical protein
MLKSSLIPLAAICSALLTGAGSAQANNPTTDDTGRLQNAVTLDRATYFPGEAAVLTFTARNPQRTPLEVAEPFAATTGCFELSKLAGAGWFVPLSGPVCPFRVIEPSSARTVFGPGEERRATASGSSLWSNLDSTASGAATGYYQVTYHNSTASAVFRVVAPRLEVATPVRLRDIAYDDPATGRATRLTAYLHVFSVRWYNQSFLCVAQSPSLQDKAIVTDHSGNVVAVNVPYRRVAVLPNPIASIKATANLDDNLAITWTDSTGASRTVLAAGTPGAPPPGEIEVGLDSTFERVPSGAGLQLHATVAGSGNNAIRWILAPGPGVPVGVPTGSMTATGHYLAPAEVTAPYAVIVVAQSVVDASKSALGVILLQPRTAIATAPPAPMTAITVSAAAPLTAPVQ